MEGTHRDTEPTAEGPSCALSGQGAFPCPNTRPDRGWPGPCSKTGHMTVAAAEMPRPLAPRPHREKRRHPRVGLSDFVAVRSEEGVFQLRGIDVSAGGMLLSGNAPLEVGLCLEIEFDLPGTSHRERFAAEIVDVRTSDAPDARFAIRFQPTSTAARRRLGLALARTIRAAAERERRKNAGPVLAPPPSPKRVPSAAGRKTIDLFEEQFLESLRLGDFRSVHRAAKGIAERTTRGERYVPGLLAAARAHDALGSTQIAHQFYRAVLFYDADHEEAQAALARIDGKTEPGAAQ